MRPPSRLLAPGAGTAMPPPLGRQGAGQGDQRAPPHSPPPSPSGRRADGGRLKKRRPRTPPEEAAAPGVRGHHGRDKRPHALPAAGRRRTGGAQDGANGAAPSEASPGKTGARTRAGGSPPPPAALTYWRPTRPRQTPRAARQPPRHKYAPGGNARDNGWQADARQGGGAGRRPPQPPLEPPPPAWEPHERPSAPPEPRGRPPSPRRDRDVGGEDSPGPAHSAPQRPEPPAPAGVASDRRAHSSAPEQRTDQAWGRRTAAHQNCMEDAPLMTLP